MSNKIENENWSNDALAGSEFLTELNKAVENLQAKYFGDGNNRGLIIIGIDSLDTPDSPDFLSCKNTVYLLGEDAILFEGLSEMLIRDENIYELFAEAYGKMQKKILFG